MKLLKIVVDEECVQEYGEIDEGFGCVEVPQVEVSFLLWYEVDELASVMVVIWWLRSFGCNCFGFGSGEVAKAQLSHEVISMKIGRGIRRMRVKMDKFCIGLRRVNK
ncbi:unnamed protein product [Vicia faba]|uniref:Uncharacterized protein n=1 Tax=Vicia faba TaxID=3906 RepID=A0AAV0ZNC5_VICFA|nr:unnamed protein product [Vicia faba]